MRFHVALQLYSVRDEFSRNSEQTLRRIAKIGYRNLELPNLMDVNAELLRKICNALDIRIISAMANLNSLRDEINAIIDRAFLFDLKYIVCPFLPPEYRNHGGYEEAARILNLAGSELAKHGLVLCYHNHAFEFETVRSQVVGFDIIYKKTDPALLKAELDIYWLKYAGQEPLLVMKEFNGRLPLLHLKDIAQNKDFIEIGQGTLDFKSIIAQAQSCGTDCLIIEQDQNWKISQFHSAQFNYDALMKYIRNGNFDEC